MELITILSTIILVATISTFILSIGAYVLYKIRSRREQKTILSPPKAAPAELVTISEDDVKEFDKISSKANDKDIFKTRTEPPVEKIYKRVVREEDKLKLNKIPSTRFTKYSSEKISKDDNEQTSKDVKWR